MTARDEILAVLPAVRVRTGSETFAPQDVIDELQRRGTSYKPSTIRTHVVSRMCAASMLPITMGEPTMISSASETVSTVDDEFPSSGR